MSRSATRLLQQTIEGLNLGGSGAVTCNCLATSELLSAHSNSTATDFIVIGTEARVFGVMVSNTGGAAMVADLYDGASTLKIHLGTLAVNGNRYISLFPNYVLFGTDVRIQKTTTGTINWTIFYHDTP